MFQIITKNAIITEKNDIVCHAKGRKYALTTADDGSVVNVKVRISVYTKLSNTIVFNACLKNFVNMRGKNTSAETVKVERYVSTTNFGTSVFRVTDLQSVSTNKSNQDVSFARVQEHVLYATACKSTKRGIYAHGVTQEQLHTPGSRKRESWEN